MPNAWKRAFRVIRRRWFGRRTPPRSGSVHEAGDSARSRIAQSRRANQKFQYCTIGATFVLIVILSFLSYRIYADTKAETEERSNRRQLLLVEQAGDRVASFLEALTASLRYSAGFLRTIEPDHPGRMAVMMGLYERLGGRFRVSELGYIQGGHAPSDVIPGGYLEKLENCSSSRSACILVIRDQAQRVTSLFAAAPVALKRDGTDGGEAQRKRDWLYARISMADLVRAFVEPVQSGGRERAWFVDGEGRIILPPGVPGLEGVHLSTLARELGDERLGVLAGRMMKEKDGFDWHLNLRPGKKEKRMRYLTAFSNFSVGQEKWTFALTAPSTEFVGLIGRLFRRGLLLTAFGFVALILAALLILDRERRRIRAEDRIHWSEQVLESNRRLQALFDGITDAIGILDKDFRIRMLNRSMGRLFSREVSELLDQKWEVSPLTAVPEPFVERSLVDDTFATGEPGFFEKSVSWEDGRRMDMEYYAYPILDASGATLQVILYLKDVTERKALEKEVLQSERLSIVGKMSEQVAHSIRNPLSAINLSAELLGDELSQFREADTSEAWTLLKSVRAEVDILRQVTADYLKFVRMPSLERTHVDCNEMIEDLLDLHAEVAVSRKIRIETQFERDIPEVILDETQMRVAIQNLILNGFDAMPDGGRLRVKTELENRHLAIRISDSGKGISLEEQASLFTPFFTTKADGTGLGLVLSRQIITEHNGSIHFESEEGTGATFIVELPLPVAQEAKA
ncbi:MAG: ATP-binding protein [Nitrospinae bacterium]|nr:ATP-binding protein [Nitrospinota bacterium]